jgi:hypothetical protein
MKKNNSFSYNLYLFFRSVASGTLKVEEHGTRRWSRTSFTMFSAWLLVIFMVIFDIYKEGFRLDVFSIMCGIALGTKVTDAYSNKINKKNEKNSNP